MNFPDITSRRRAGAIFATGLFLSVAALAGCTSDPIDTDPRARNTGTYPNLNIRPRGQTTQFSEGERAAGTARLQAAQRAHQAQAGTRAPNDVAALKRLGENHGPEALRVIEE